MCENCTCNKDSLSKYETAQLVAELKSRTDICDSFHTSPDIACDLDFYNLDNTLTDSHRVTEVATILVISD